MIEAILKRGIRLVRPALNIPEHGRFLFQFLSIGWDQQNGVVVRFAKRKAREGFVFIAEVRVTMIQNFASLGRAIDILIKFSDCLIMWQNCAVKNNKKCNKILGYMNCFDKDCVEIELGTKLNLSEQICSQSIFNKLIQVV